MDLCRLSIAAALLVGVLPLGAQEGGTQGQVEVFGESIDVRVVNVEAIVTDGKGERVRDLSPTDFRLLVDGREVPVEYFTEVAEGKSTTDAGPAGPVAPGEAVPRSYLVYIDESFSLASVRNEILEKIERDLSLLHSTDRMAVLAFDGVRIEVLSGWTGDRAALAAALEQARQRPAQGNLQWANERKLQADVDWVEVSRDSLDDGDSKVGIVAAILRALSGRISPEARTQTGKTAAAAAASLRGFEAPPGRKLLLMLSGAWSLRVAPRLYAPLIEAANRLGYTIYTVDTAKSQPHEISALGALAGLTGGKVLVSAQMEVFRQAVDDSGTYYWLGFTPAWKANDHGHRIEVELRRPGLKARTRSGFTDLSQQTANALKAESVLHFGGAASDKRLIVQLGAPRRAGRGQVEIPVTLGVPVEALALTPRGSGYIAETPLAVAALDEKGGRIDLPGSRLRVALETPPHAGTYARFQTVLKLRNAGQHLVFTVHDAIQGTALWGDVRFVPQPKGSRKSGNS